MLENGSPMVTAWDGEKLVGISRIAHGFRNVAYLADLPYIATTSARHRYCARREKHGRIASNLLDRSVSRPLANEYYSKIGFTHNPRA